MKELVWAHSAQALGLRHNHPGHSHHSGSLDFALVPNPLLAGRSAASGLAAGVALLHYASRHFCCLSCPFCPSSWLFQGAVSSQPGAYVPDGLWLHTVESKLLAAPQRWSRTRRTHKSIRLHLWGDDGNSYTLVEDGAHERQWHTASQGDAAVSWVVVELVNWQLAAVKRAGPADRSYSDWFGFLVLQSLCCFVSSGASARGQLHHRDWYLEWDSVYLAKPYSLRSPTRK